MASSAVSPLAKYKLVRTFHLDWTLHVDCTETYYGLYFEAYFNYGQEIC